MVEVRAALEALITAPIESPDDAERAARAAEALADYIRSVDRAEAVLGVVRAVDPRDDRDPSGELAGLTLHDAAERVLAHAGVPLHVGELGRRIKAGGWTHKRSKRPRRDQINYQLAARLPRHADRFVRVAPNTFGLVRWGSEKRVRPQPRVGLFHSATGDTSVRIGDHPEEVFEDI